MTSNEIFDDVLYIIGNGFDLHHGVLSGYRHFAAWIQRHNEELYRELSEVCRVDFLWKDFESALAYVNRDNFLCAGDILLPDNWTVDDGYAPLFYAQDYVRELAGRLWHDIEKWFRKWARTVTWESISDQRKVRMDYLARFITFNYTPFLETMYGIPVANILYIHGKATGSPRLPLIGHDGRDTFDLWFRGAGNEMQKHYRGHYSMLPGRQSGK